MKKFLALFLAIIMVLTLAACGDDKKDENSDNDLEQGGDTAVKKLSAEETAEALLYAAIDGDLDLIYELSVPSYLVEDVLARGLFKSEEEYKVWLSEKYTTALSEIDPGTLLADVELEVASEWDYGSYEGTPRIEDVAARMNCDPTKISRMCKFKVKNTIEKHDDDDVDVDSENGYLTLAKVDSTWYVLLDDYFAYTDINDVANMLS